MRNDVEEVDICSLNLDLLRYVPCVVPRGEAPLTFAPDACPSTYLRRKKIKCDRENASSASTSSSNEHSLNSLDADSLTLNWRSAVAPTAIVLEAALTSGWASLGHLHLTDVAPAVRALELAVASGPLASATLEAWWQRPDGTATNLVSAFAEKPAAANGLRVFRFDFDRPKRLKKFRLRLERRYDVLGVKQQTVIKDFKVLASAKECRSFCTLETTAGEIPKSKRRRLYDAESDSRVSITAPPENRCPIGKRSECDIDCTDDIVPERYLDALTCERMRQPIRLPSNNYIDADSLYRLMQNCPDTRSIVDPFTGVKLAVADVFVDAKLGEEIDRYFAARKTTLSLSSAT